MAIFSFFLPSLKDKKRKIRIEKWNVTIVFLIVFVKKLNIEINSK